jgi:acetyl-CoA acyltransferase
MEEAVVIDCLRTAVGKSGRGTLRYTRPDDMAATVMQALLKRYPQVEPSMIEDVIMGCATPEGESGMNVARVAALRAGLPDTVPGVTINRFCSSGLQSIAMAAEKIRAGYADIILAGGTESMSMLPMSAQRLAPNPWMVENIPQIYIGMGLTAENIYQRWNIGRDEQDEFSYRSHQNALNAQTEGKFDDEIVPLDIETTVMGPDGKPKTTKAVFAKDEGPRADTSKEALGKLKPVFHAKGTVTAGNSSQTSDGAACALVMSASRAAALGLKPMARFAGFAVGGCAPEIMGIGPKVAVPKALKIAGIKIEDIGVTELNEAFAVQALAVVKETGINMETLNVNGGAIALGHPLGCTGAKLTATILREMKRRNARYGMVTMCIGGGQGAAGIFENLN